MRPLCLVAIILLAGLPTAKGQIEIRKPRLLVLTDIGGDPDDQQSLVRLLHYANEFEIEGLIASASGTPNELREKVTRPDLIREIVAAYGQVHGNLAKHAAGYPPADELLLKIKSGNPNRGLEAIGEGHDTEGSRWIIAAADRDDSRPLCITIWGGQTDLAQALWRIRADRGPSGLKKFIARLRIYDIADQDGIANWMFDQFPGMFYILAAAPTGRDKREAAFRGMYLGGDESLVSRDWMETHIRQNHGPLAALYPPRTWTAPNPYSAIKEGDTPSWFYFLPHGLDDPSHPEWGGYGGRFQQRADGIYRDAHDTASGTTDARATVWRWRPAFQTDFQARLDWGISGEFSKANHAPIAVLDSDHCRSIVHMSAKPGAAVELSAEGSSDPDNHSLTYRWFIYPEAGTYKDRIELTASEGPTTSLTAPQVTRPATIHVILEVTDSGEPRLTSFRRAVVHIRDGT